MLSSRVGGSATPTAKWSAKVFSHTVSSGWEHTDTTISAGGNYLHFQATFDTRGRDKRALFTEGYADVLFSVDEKRKLILEN